MTMGPYKKSRIAAREAWKKHAVETHTHPEIPNEKAGQLRRVANYLEDRGARDETKGMQDYPTVRKLETDTHRGYKNLGHKESSRE